MVSILILDLRLEHSNFGRLEQEIESLLQWISPLEPQKRHKDVRAKRLPNTGKWFLESDIFRNWRDGDEGPGAFGYGIPGAGKTVIR